MAGLSVLVQAQVDDLLDGIQAVSGINAGAKRKKALNRFSAFYFGGEPPELSAAQVERVLIGDSKLPDEDSKVKKRAGIVQLCGLLKRRNAKAALTQSAVVAIELLDKIIHVHPEYPSAPIFRDCFARLPIELHSQMHLDQHILSRSRRAAFRLLRTIIRFYKSKQQDGQQDIDPLEILIRDDEAHDSYLDWDEENESASEDSVHDQEEEDAGPEEWDHVNIADESDDELHTNESITKRLLESVQKTMSPNSSEPFASPISEAATSPINSPIAVDISKVRDPLGIVQEDLKTFDVWNRKSMKLVAMGEDSFSPSTATSSFVDQDQNAVVQSASTPPSPTAQQGQGRKKSRFGSLFRRRERTNSNSSISSSRERGYSQSSLMGDSGLKATPSFVASVLPPTVAVKSVKTDAFQDIKHEQEEVIREIQKRNRLMHTTTKSGLVNSDTPVSCLPTSERFNPSLFLWRVHRNTDTQDLMNGMRNLDAGNEDQKTMMKALVYDNFDEFVHCRSTIGHIQTLMQQEVGAKSERRTSKPTKAGMKNQPKENPSWTMKIGRSLDAAIRTSDQHFEPLLEKRKEIRKLRRAAEMLKRLEYLWQLPQQLRTLMKECRWIEAVIEFANAGQHLAILDKSRSAENSHHSSGAAFTLDAVRDLESCGLALSSSLLEKLTKPVDLPSAVTSVAQTTSDALHGEQHGNLVSTEALSLLLELRDHVPKTNQIFKMLDMEDDPFLVLARAQQQHARSLLDKIAEAPNDTKKSRLRSITDANEIATEYILVWEDARVCLDPSSASGGKEHIFDVLNRVKGEGGATVNHGPFLKREDSVQDEEDDFLNPFRSRLQRSGSVDLLFDIRKRSAANCSLEDLAERRKASDGMAFEILKGYILTSRTLVLRAIEMGDIRGAVVLLVKILATIRRIRHKGAMNSAMHAKIRLSKTLNLGLENGSIGLEEKARRLVQLEELEAGDILKTVEELSVLTIKTRMDALVATIETEHTNSNPGLELQQAQNSAGFTRRGMAKLQFVSTLISEIKLALDDVRSLLHSPHGASLWRDGFLREQAVEISKALTKCVKILCEWISKVSKTAMAVDAVPVLFSDCNYCRVYYMDEMQRLLQQSTDPEFKLVAKASRETLAMQLQRQLQRIEEGLMANYVQQRGKRMKALLDEAFLFDNNIQDWPNPPTAIRHYTLDILLVYANVIAECTRHVGKEACQQLLCGLTRRLAHMFVSAVEQLRDSLARSPGVVVQLQSEIAFLRFMLQIYETPKAVDGFTDSIRMLDEAYGNDEEQRTPSDRQAVKDLVDAMMKNVPFLSSHQSILQH